MYTKVFNIILAAWMALVTVQVPIGALAKTPSPDAAYPCEGHACGCASAEDCATACCCYPEVFQEKSAPSCCSEEQQEPPEEPLVSFLAALGCSGFNPDLFLTGKLLPGTPPATEIFLHELPYHTQAPAHGVRPSSSPLEPPDKIPIA